MESHTLTRRDLLLLGVAAGAVDTARGQAGAKSAPRHIEMIVCQMAKRARRTFAVAKAASSNSKTGASF